MLIRCNVDETSGLLDLHQCAQLAAFMKSQGFRIAFAINRAGVDAAREYLGAGPEVYRIPDNLDEDASRLGHLGRTHKHKVVFVYLRKATSAYLFQVHRLFDFTAVIDRGSPYLIYANLVINGGLNAQTHAYNCCAEARLLLGPKFHICDPLPVAAPAALEQLDVILVNLGRDPLLLRPIVEAIAGMELAPEIHVLLRAETDEAEVMAMAADYPNARVMPVISSTSAFAYHRYGLIITECSGLCMELAHQGLCFITIATDKARLQDAYVLDQLGTAPTLGWHGSKNVEAVRQTISRLAADMEMRARYSRNGRQLVDGQGLLRIARFIPAEDVINSL